MRPTEKIEFANGRGQQLAAALNLPLRPQPRAWVLFAHCFTCGKDILAANRIARSLAAHGYAVMRFDFTGLGNSQGDFANSGFSSNVEDLVQAANYLRDNHAAPALLIGHSLGGTAVLAAAERIPECKALVTIGSPADPEHVLRQFGDRLDEIETRGQAEVNLAGRPFTIRREFLEDARASTLTERLGNLRRALLVMHAPADDIVPIDQASEIFIAARHPKSFVSLDQADHLLSKAEDAQYAADTIHGWVSRYLEVEEVQREVPGGQVLVSELNQRFLREVASDDHAWLADEPRRVGGQNLGPDPYEHLLAALGTCTSMTLRMYANHKKWPLDDVDILLKHSRGHAEDCEHCDQEDARLERIERTITLYGDLDVAQRERLMEIANRCPVHRTLMGTLSIEDEPG